MHVREIMSDSLVFCTADEGIEEAAIKMRDYNCGALVVVDDDETRRPVGVLTDRDITVRVVASGDDPRKKFVADAMTDAAVTTRPDASVQECARRMEENSIRRIIVVGKDGAGIGVVSQADLAREAPPYLPRERS